MLEVVDLECVRGERNLFAATSFRLESGEWLHLRGGNGSGKTSLLRLLCGFAPPAAGEIRWQGQAVGRLGEAYRRALCYLGHANAIKDEFTPLENLLCAARLAGRMLSEDAALDALARLGLAGRADLACRYLSQGQKRRVALARLIGETPSLWLLDEPFVALDAAAVDFVAGLIGQHLQRGGLCVLTTHQEVAIAAGRGRPLTLRSPSGMAQC